MYVYIYIYIHIMGQVFSLDRLKQTGKALKDVTVQGAIATKDGVVTATNATILAFILTKDAIMSVAWGPAKATRSVGVRMIDNTRDYINSIFFVLITAVPFFVFMILASTTQTGGMISGINPETQTGIYLSQSLFYMSFLPFIQAFCRLHEGLLLSFQLSHIVSFAAVITLVGQILSIVILLNISRAAQRDILGLAQCDRILRGKPAAHGSCLT